MKNPDGSVFEGAGLAVQRGARPGPQRVPGLQQARGPRVVGRALQAADRRGHRGHLERHERAGGLRSSRPHAAARRAPRQRGRAQRPARDPQRLRPADDARHLRGPAAPAAGRAALRADARLLRGRPALRRRLARGQQSRLVDLRASIPMLAGHGPLGLRVRGQRHRRLRGRALSRAGHALGAARACSTRSCACTPRWARPTGALVVRDRARAAQPARHRAALPAAAPHLQRDARGEPDRRARHAPAVPRVPRRRQDVRARRPVPVRPRPARRPGRAGGRRRAVALPARRRLVRLLDRRAYRAGASSASR